MFVELGVSILVVEVGGGGAGKAGVGGDHGEAMVLGDSGCPFPGREAVQQPWEEFTVIWWQRGLMAGGGGSTARTHGWGRGFEVVVERARG